MNSLKQKIYFHREKEENWDISEKLKKKNFKKYEDIVYLGSEISLNVEIIEDEKGEIVVKVLKLQGVNIKDKGICI